jgi:hypothetical protein
MRELDICVKNGKLISGGPELKQLVFEKDGIFRVRFESVEKRSVEKNKYYWKVVLPIVLRGLWDVGYYQFVDTKDVHWFLKQIFLKGGSTTKLNQEEFELYLEKIRMMAAEYLSTMIPLPNEPLVFYE